MNGKISLLGLDTGTIKQADIQLNNGKRGLIHTSQTRGIGGKGSEMEMKAEHGVYDNQSGRPAKRDSTHGDIL